MMKYKPETGRGIFFGNMKGGVGKSTLCAYTCAMLKSMNSRLDLMLVDTDPQASTSQMMKGVLRAEKLRHMPIGDRYDNAMLSMLDGVVKSHFARKGSLLIIDSASGKIGNLWQILMHCNAVIVPTSLSWLDMQPTLDYIQEIDSRKSDFSTNTPHIIVVPNRNSPNQKDYGKLYEAAEKLNVVIAPPVCDYSAVRRHVADFRGLDQISGTRFATEVSNLAKFINSHIQSGKLDEIYAGP